MSDHPSVAERVRAAVVAAKPGSFISSRELLDLVGTGTARTTLDAAVRRLTSELPLTRVRPGLYYKGKPTCFGPTTPSPLAVAYELCRERGVTSGVGPAGYSAARTLGLTTQMPGREEVAVPGRCPHDLPLVHFTSRSPGARTGLLPEEVAVLEVLRDWPRFSERGWPALVEAVAELADLKRVRPDTVAAAARRERHTAARERAAELVRSLDARSSPGR